jgi:ABC-2 type transport system ATP-binding protein
VSSFILDAANVHAGYGSREILKGVSLRLRAGEWFCLLGPNGSGKSTFLHCIGGRLSPSQGTVDICGHSIVAEPLAARRRLGFGCAPDQLPRLLTGRQCLEVYALAKEVPEVEGDVMQLAQRLGFMKFIDRFVDTYSLGTRQKLCVLLALLGSPSLIVLDEAFNGLDPASALVLKQHLQERISSQQCSVLLATHSLDIVEHYADHAALLLEGRIASEWNAEAIAALRTEGGNRLEAALAEASEPLSD